MNEEDIPNVNESPLPNEQPVIADPVIEFLSHIKINTNLFDEIRNSFSDPEKYGDYFKAPDLFVMMNMIGIIQEYDPNKDNPEGAKDHLAFVNLIKWMLLRFATDPVWISYIGWFGRMYGCCMHPSSYWPVKHSNRFEPEHFFVRGESINVEEENKKLKDPQDIFKWKENW